MTTNQQLKIYRLSVINHFCTKETVLKNLIYKKKKYIWIFRHFVLTLHPKEKTKIDIVHYDSPYDS